MGAVLEMIFPRIIGALSAIVLLLLSGCNSGNPADFAAGRVSALTNTFLSTTHLPHDDTFSLPDTAKFAPLRTSLATAGQPVLFIKVKSLSFVDLLTPFGLNNGVRTWSSAHKISVSMRDDVLVATRGFGNDLMSAVAPSLALISSGTGQFSRSYYELNGGDQMIRTDFSCTFSQSGNQTLNIFGVTYATRTVLEACAGPGNSFQNEYWFDQNGRLRQSKQYFAARNTSLLVQRIID